MITVKHFGVNVLGKSSGLKLTKENYIEKIVFKSRYVKEYYTESVKKDHTENCLYNYDIQYEVFPIII